MKTISYFAVLIVCACFITFMQYEALAQAQRMGIRAGIYKAPGKSSVRVDATCIDQTRDAPSGNNSYKYVIQGDSFATIKVGNQIMSLQKAIKKKMISVSGNKMTLTEFMKLMEDKIDKGKLPDDEKKIWSKMVCYWKEAPEWDKQNVKIFFTFTRLKKAGWIKIENNYNNMMMSQEQLENLRRSLLGENITEQYITSEPKEDCKTSNIENYEEDNKYKFDPIISKIQDDIQKSISNLSDFRTMEITNNISDSIEIEFRSFVVVGENQETLGCVHQDILSNRIVNDQGLAWYLTTLKYQEILTELKFYSGVPNGILDDATKSAIKKFQKSKKLKETGIIDSKTEKAICKEYYNNVNYHL